MTSKYQDVLAELLPAEVSFIISQFPTSMDTSASLPGPSSVADNPPEDEVADQVNGDGEGRKRRRIERDWPAVGTLLTAEYFGEEYQAEIIPANKKLKSNRQIRIASGPSRGQICDSLSEAMIAATELQRATHNLGRKGVANGWHFWQWPGKPEDIQNCPDDENES